MRRQGNRLLGVAGLARRKRRLLTESPPVRLSPHQQWGVGEGGLVSRRSDDPGVGLETSSANSRAVVLRPAHSCEPGVMLIER